MGWVAASAREPQLPNQHKAHTDAQDGQDTVQKMSQCIFVAATASTPHTMARLLPVLRVVLALVPMLAVSLVVAQSVPPAPRNMRTNFMQPDTHTFGIDLAGGPGLHLSWENAAPDAAASYEQASLQIQVGTNARRVAGSSQPHRLSPPLTSTKTRFTT